jgi:hypothetical protein
VRLAPSRAGDRHRLEAGNLTGTIAGEVSADSAVSLAGRTVTATDESSGTKYTTSTGAQGGYTIKVPAGRKYRLDVQLRPGEALSKRPDPTQVNASDLDPGRDFVITAAQ